MLPKPLRIAVASYYLPSESKIGAGYNAHRLAEALCHRGHHVTMISPCRKPEGAIYDHLQVRLQGRFRTFRWGWALSRVDVTGFDVLNAHGDNHFCRRTSSTIVRTMTGSCFSEAIHIKGAKERLRMFLLGLTEVIGSLRAHHTVAISNNTRTFYPWIRTVIPCGIDLKLFHPGAKEPVPTILFVGTFSQRKRGRFLMDAFREDVLPRVRNAQLWMVCEDAPQAQNVSVLGRLEDVDLADRYRRAWLFCLPSSYEGFGVPYIEAIASGTAVVATPNPGSKEVLQNGRLGKIVGVSDLGDTLAQLLENPNEIEHLASVAGADVERYGWPQIAKAYEDVFEVAIRKRTKRS